MPQVEDSGKQLREWFLWCVEVDDSFGVPLVEGRRNLWVGRTRQTPEAYVERLGLGRRWKHLKGHVLGPRPDLCSREPITKHASGQAKRHLMCELRKLGHRVNGEAPYEYRVYVVEMTDAGHKRENDPELPWVYVGETTKPVEDRMLEHREDLPSGGGHGLAARPFPERFVRGRPDLYECYGPVYSRAQSQALENRLKAELVGLGYSVWNPDPE